MSEQKVQNFKVKGEPPLKAVPALYSNFLGVSRVGTEVQFEFVFLDLNHVAALLEQFKDSKPQAAPQVEGKTVAKIVMPAASFIQVHEQLQKIFAALKAELPAVPGETNEQLTRSTG